MSPALKGSLITLQQSCTLNSAHHHIKPHPGTVSLMPQKNDFPTRMCLKNQNFLSHIYSCRMFSVNPTLVGQAECPGHILPPQVLVLAKIGGTKSWQRRLKQKVLQMFQCQNTLILVSTSLAYFTKNPRYQKNSQIQCGRLEWKAQTNQISAQPNSSAATSPWPNSWVRLQTPARCKSPKQKVALAIPSTALHREAKNQMAARNKEKGEHLIFSQGYSEAVLMASVGSYSAKAGDHSIWGFTHTSPVFFSQGCHTQHCSSCLCHPVDSVNLNDLKRGSFLKQFAGISSSSQWGAQLKARSLAGIGN